ncbi:MAG: flavodoxin family protein [Solobacterium sp.]|nr:flavodoxin family protein [Solobacterium sp.]
MKNVLIISASPAKDGNTDLLSAQFKRGAEEAGHRTEQVFLRQKKIGYCHACNYCKRPETAGVCAIKDDMAELMEQLRAADVIVLATPVYYYNVNARMKTFIDRTYADFMNLKNNEFYYILASADPSTESIDAAVNGLRGFTVCLDNAMEKGIIYGVNAGAHGSVRDAKAMNEAYELGKGI